MKEANVLFWWYLLGGAILLMVTLNGFQIESPYVYAGLGGLWGMVVGMYYDLRKDT